MEQILDIFRNDAFSYTSLQRVVDNAPFVPTMLGEMRLFDPKPIPTREVLIYEKDGGFALIPYTEIGAPDVQQARRQGRIFALSTLRISKKDTVRAGELTAIADMALPETLRVRNTAGLVAERTIQLKTDMEATKEFARLSALGGKIIDPVTREILFDYFDVFGVVEPDVIEIDFASDNLSEEQALMYFQENMFLPMRTVLENRWMPNTQIGCFCGDVLWGKLMRNRAFRQLYLLMLQGREIARQSNPLARPNNWETVYFGGINWTNYRGSTGGEIGIEPDEGMLFPIGAKDVFNVYWGPGETFVDATIKGLAQYLYLVPDPNAAMASFIDIVLRAYPLYACIFPKALLRVRVKP